MKFGLSVVIPAYNEEGNISKCLTAVKEVLEKTDWDWEIIVVNDGSKDRTGIVAQETIKKLGSKNARVLKNQPNKGYGGSLKTGFYAAKKEFIAFIGADNQYDFSEIREFTKKQQETNADIVSGIRPGGGHDPFYRLFFRWGWNTLVRAIFGYLATDIDCGFKLFRRSLLDRVSLPSDGAMIDTQMFAGARARGMKVAEVEVSHFSRTAGQSTGGNPKVVFKALRELVSFWWQLKQEILVERGLAVFRWEALAILAILAVSAFMRLWHIDQYMTYLGDEGRDAIAMRDIILARHFPAIGPGTSIGNMYLGPLYYYLAAPSLWVFNFSPVGPSVFVASLGLLTLALLWWIGRQWFGRWPALAVSALYAISPTVITYSRSSWNPNIMPFFALLTMYGIWKVWRFGYWRWLIISAVSFAFILNSHYLGLLLFPPIVLFWLLSPRKSGSSRYVLVSCLTLFVLLAPLLIYDLRHDWQNFAAIKTFFTNRQTTVNLKPYKAIPHLWPLWVQINASLLTAKNLPLARLISLLLPALVFLRLKRKPNSDLVFTLTWLGFGLIGLGLYKQHIYDHYFGFLFPAVFLLLGFAVWSLRLLAIPLLLLLFTINLKQTPFRHPPNNQLAHTIEISDFIIEKAGNKSFNLALIAKTNYDASYRYFLQLNKAPYFTIHDRLSDQLFVICEPHPDINCNPLGHPLWEIAAFGWAEVDNAWEFPWGVRLYRLTHTK